MFARLYAMVAADRLHVSRGLRRFPLWLSVAGLIFVAVGIVMPAYTDPGAAERIIAAVECEPGIPNPSIPDENHDYKCPNELWFRSMASLSTVKWNFVDGGGGLFVSDARHFFPAAAQEILEAMDDAETRSVDCRPAKSGLAGSNTSLDLVLHNRGSPSSLSRMGRLDWDSDL